MSNPVDKKTVVYILGAMLLDASAIAFGMGLLRVSTLCKRLARRTDERWNEPGEGFYTHDEEDAVPPQQKVSYTLPERLAVAAVALENDAASFDVDNTAHVGSVREAANALGALASHGCLTGDCPHAKQAQCDAALAQAYKEAFGS